ncbi:MAG: DAK2 domain-containing protein [Thermoleophilia bacterium]|nr:DAK2 domain-containing protein [Thermoleophilia bacterium]
MARDDSAGLSVGQARAVVLAGFYALEARKQEVNDLNVYPVPDGDTGTNLCLTVRSVVDELRAAPDDLGSTRLCEMVAGGALMGARGNSGVILSQMVRGALEPFAAGAPLTIETVVSAFRRATDTAYRAVRKPVEGTMLTVIREVAEAAESVGAGVAHSTFIDVVLEAGWNSVRRTPTLLKVLADAGVVDAGGYGLMVLIEGMARGGGSVPREDASELARQPSAAVLEESESAYTYCTSFLVAGHALDATTFEEALISLGDSLLVVGTESQLKVHIHTDEPGTVLTLATARGVVREVEIDNMKDQTAAREARLRGHETPPPPGRTQVVAVVVGEGMKRLFRSMGAAYLVDGGQSMNPSAEELLRAVEATDSAEVVLLPNTKNIIMAAEQAATMSTAHVGVVPARSMQAGLSAMVAYDPEATVGQNGENMTVAFESLVTAEVTRAVRDSRVNELHIRQGEFMGLVDDRVVVSNDDLAHVVTTVASHLVDGGRELMTVLVGGGADAALAAEAVERLRGLYPELELEVHEGGQPLYPLLLSAE